MSASGPSGCSSSCLVGPRLASAGSRGCCWGFSALLGPASEALGGTKKPAGKSGPCCPVAKLRDWRSVGVSFWPQGAWHLRLVRIFEKVVFRCVFENPRQRRVRRSLGGTWAPPGPLWRGRGPKNQPKVRATLRPDSSRVLRLPSEPQSVVYDVSTCGKLSLRKACFHKPS